jgi:hypothetical protein
MTFLVAAGVLAVTLLVGALVAPRSFHHPAFRMDACALDSGDWGEFDSSCPDMAMAPKRPSQGRQYQPCRFCSS